MLKVKFWRIENVVLKKSREMPIMEDIEMYEIED